MALSIDSLSLILTPVIASNYSPTAGAVLFRTTAPSISIYSILPPSQVNRSGLLRSVSASISTLTSDADGCGHPLFINLYRPQSLNPVVDQRERAAASPLWKPHRLCARGIPRDYPIIKLYRPQSLNPVVDQREELPLLPFGYPIGFVPAVYRGITQ